MTPRVSVVTAVYNGEDYFDRAVPSILRQTLTDFEFIVIDDGSTDRTPERLREIADRDRRVRLVSPGRIGFVNSLNMGIERARGEYIARQDFDDASYPERLERQVEFLDDRPDIGVVGGYYVLVDERRGERYVRKPPLDHTDIVRSMARGIPFAHTCVTFRKAAWAQAGGYPRVEDIEDLRLWIELARLGWKMSNLPHVVGEHYVHGESYWHREFRYWRRQQTLRRVQWKAVRELDLPLWMAIYPIGRLFYGLMPHGAKRVLRRTVGGSKERDLDSGNP